MRVRITDELLPLFQLERNMRPKTKPWLQLLALVALWTSYTGKWLTLRSTGVFTRTKSKKKTWRNPSLWKCISLCSRFRGVSAGVRRAYLHIRGTRDSSWRLGRSFHFCYSYGSSESRCNLQKRGYEYVSHQILCTGRLEHRFYQ